MDYLNGLSTQGLSDLERQLSELRGGGISQPTRRLSLWDMIDAEIQPLTETQKTKLAENPEYIKIQNRLNAIMNIEFIQMMKPYIERNREGAIILQEQLNFIRENKNKVIVETNAELEVLKRFQEAAKTNPSITWDEFVKSIS